MLRAGFDADVHLENEGVRSDSPRRKIAQQLCEISGANP
jgi:hypothetical protein